jgi:hypothetical protein
MTSSVATGRVLMELSRNGELPAPKAVGKRLNAVRGRVIGGGWSLPTRTSEVGFVGLVGFPPPFTPK